MPTNTNTTFHPKYLLLCLLLIISPTKSVDFWESGNNTITIKMLQSNLTKAERENYYYWIGIRNNFFYESTEGILEKNVKYFSPEDPEYYGKIMHFGTIFFVLAGLVLLALCAYLIIRFFLHGCQGPKIIENSYLYGTYSIIIGGFIASIVLLAFTTYYTNQSQ